MLVVVIIIIIIGLILYALLARKRTKNKGILATVNLINHSGLEIPNALYKINAYEDRFEFTHNERKTILAYSRVESISLTTEVERITKSKGVVGRSIVGGAIGGATGAVVGGMTGQNKTKNKLWPYLIISYTGKDGSISNIALTGTRISDMENPIITSFYNKVKKLMPSEKSTTVL